jgi:proline iminopeptidase
VNRYVEEVEEVRKGLNLEKFYILGHSWGAMLGQLYAAKYPNHLNGLILSNVPPEIRDIQKRNIALNEWRDDIHRKITSLPPFTAIPPTRVDSIRKGIKANAPFQYAELKRVYENKRDSIISRTNTYRLSDVMPEPMVKNNLHLDRKMREESGMYQKIFKPDYPAADEKIKCPVLILGGEYDRWFPKIYPEMKKQFTQTKVRVYLCPNGSHFSMWDDTQNYFREVVRFVMDVENNQFDPTK